MSNQLGTIGLFADVIKSISEHRDGTWGPQESAPNGFFVGGNQPSVEFHRNDAINPDVLTKLSKLIASAVSRGSNVGVWTDESGKVYVDDSQWIEDLDLALQVGKTNGEYAIWDVAEEREITI